jgi:hypothetical protein
MSRHHQQQGTGSSSMRPDPEGETLSPKRGQPHPRYGDVTFKDQVREDLLSASLAIAAAAATPLRERVAAANEIPMVNAVAVSASQISAEAEEDRLHDVEQRAAAAAAEAAAEAVRDQVAQLEQKLAAVRAPPHCRSGNRNDVADADDYDEDDENNIGRLHNAERRAATAEAMQRDQEVRLARLERELAVVRPPPLQQLPQPPPQQPLPQQIMMTTTNTWTITIKTTTKKTRCNYRRTRETTTAIAAELPLPSSRHNNDNDVALWSWSWRCC